jgi:hypothetical protein
MNAAEPEGELLFSWRAAQPDEVDELARRWLRSSALDQLMTALGGPRPADTDATALRAWSASRLDTRRGVERREATPIIWPATWTDGLVEAARPLGLLATAPASRSFYDAALILGGATTGNRLRVAFTHELIREGRAFAEIVALTADRPLSARELTSEPDAAGDGTEWRNLLRHVDGFFGPLTPLSSAAQSNNHSATAESQDTLYRGQHGTQVRLIVAPGVAGRRPTTADAVDFYLSRRPDQARGSILIVTSAIYAPYQFFVIAPQLLTGGASTVELVGTTTTLDAPRALIAQRVGQEIHAAVEAAAQLCNGG